MVYFDRYGINMVNWIVEFKGLRNALMKYDFRTWVNKFWYRYIALNWLLKLVEMDIVWIVNLVDNFGCLIEWLNGTILIV